LMVELLERLDQKLQPSRATRMHELIGNEVDRPRTFLQRLIRRSTASRSSSRRRFYVAGIFSSECSSTSSRPGLELLRGLVMASALPYWLNDKAQQGAKIEEY